LAALCYEYLFRDFFSFSKTIYIKNELFEKFFQILSLCHTVQVDNSLKEIYQASSPDEFSFIKYCLKLEIVYLGDRKEATSSARMIRTVSVKGTERTYEILEIFDFDSTRKRMSVILRDLSTNQVILFTKGAESSIFKCCSEGAIQQCDADIGQFSRLGWRTLALAYRLLSEREYEDVKAKMAAAMNDILRRNQMLAEAYDQIEAGLTLAGATAIEDKLQDKVADTLEFLRDAGIKIWVLTGDKKETAINISNSCKHFSPDMVKVEICDLKKRELIQQRIEYFKDQ
jgi:phospholipid-translocating ATPase